MGSRKEKRASFQRLHLFKSGGRIFAFDPESIGVEQIDANKSKLKPVSSAAKGFPNLGSRLGWEAKKVVGVRARIQEKHIGLSSPDQKAEFQEFCKKVELLVNISQACNLSCAYCFVDQGRFCYKKTRPKYLSEKLAKKLIHILPEALPWAEEFTIHFYGGEPLLNLPAIKACVESSKQLGDNRFRYAITTNGTVLSKEVFSVLKRGNFSVVLSVDGPAEIHDTVRRTKNGEPTHHRVMEFLSQLRAESRLSIRGSSVVRRGWNLKEAVDYLDSLPVDLIKAQIVRVPASHPLSLTKLERINYLAHLSELAQKVIESIHYNAIPKDDRFSQLVLQLLVRKKRVSFCGAGRWSFGVAADGTILPCALLAGDDSLELGHLEDPKAEWVKRGIEWADSQGPRRECEECWAKPLCGGGCYAMMSLSGMEECELMRAVCEGALSIFAAFRDHPQNLLVLAGIIGE